MLAAVATVISEIGSGAPTVRSGSATTTSASSCCDLRHPRPGEMANRIVRVIEGSQIENGPRVVLDPASLVPEQRRRCGAAAGDGRGGDLRRKGFRAIRGRGRRQRSRTRK